MQMKDRGKDNSDILNLFQEYVVLYDLVCQVYHDTFLAQ